MQGFEREIASRLNQTVSADENVLHKFIDAAGDLRESFENLGGAAA